MPNSSSIIPVESAVVAVPINHFRRRLAICLAQTMLNAIVVTRFAGTLYRATHHEPLEQIGVLLLFAVLLGSLTRMWQLTVNSRLK